jgi:hypothetical protein
MWSNFRNSSDGQSFALFVDRSAWLWRGKAASMEHMNGLHVEPTRPVRRTVARFLQARPSFTVPARRERFP